MDIAQTLNSVKSEPFVVFRSLLGARVERASNSLYGSMALRAYQLCLPHTAASGLGWAVFPAADFAVIYDGTSVLWRLISADENAEALADEGEWQLLSHSAQLPGVPEQWQATRNGMALPDSPPFLYQDPVITNFLHVASGICARTQPGWGLLARPAPNLPRNPGAEVMEALIETDWFFGPISMQLRLTQTDIPTVFTRTLPLFTLQPVHRAAFDEQNLDNFELTSGLNSLTDDEWRELNEFYQRRQERTGQYKLEARRQSRAFVADDGRCPVPR